RRHELLDREQAGAACDEARLPARRIENLVCRLLLEKKTLPTLYAACLFTLWKSRHDLDTKGPVALAVALLAALVSAFRVIRALSLPVQTHDLRACGWYRPAAGLAAPSWRALGRWDAVLRRPDDDVSRPRARSISGARRAAGVAIWHRAPPCTSPTMRAAPSTRGEPESPGSPRRLVKSASGSRGNDSQRPRRSRRASCGRGRSGF